MRVMATARNKEMQSEELIETGKHNRRKERKKQRQHGGRKRVKEKRKRKEEEEEIRVPSGGCWNCASGLSEEKWIVPRDRGDGKGGRKRTIRGEGFIG
jgi:hypothetical protein